MKKWDVVHKVKSEKLKVKSLTTNEIIRILLNNRGLKNKKEIDSFLNPKLSDLKIENSGINLKDAKKAIARINRSIDGKEMIIIFGDYDVDGICGSAILWETLNKLGADAMPYIPHRIDEGYGLSEKGIENILKKFPNTKLIITVDNGIVANSAVEFANKNKIDVVITDHHVPSENKPKAFAIVHTTKLCGAGVAFLLSQEILDKSRVQNQKLDILKRSHLELAAIATVCDLVPVIELNRIVLKFGLDELRKTERKGLLALINDSGIDKQRINVYEIGHILGPRLNAMGRLELAMESLRLLCTNNEKRSEELARKLSETNKRRQEITIESVEHARKKVEKYGVEIPKLIFIGDKNYQPGVIGLIAGRLTEYFYRPSIVLSIGEKYSKASARSIQGFNIIEFIRRASELLEDAGGHPMAAGFTVETDKIEKLSKKFQQLSEKAVTLDLLERTLKIDVEIKFENINHDFYDQILKLAPFGVRNYQPVFLTKNITISDMRLVGLDNQHLALRFIGSDKKPIDAIAFRFADRVNEIKIGDEIDAVYTIDRETWKGNTRFKLKLKDFKKGV